jgi:ESCRT-I complex subunit TSG101
MTSDSIARYLDAVLGVSGRDALAYDKSRSASRLRADFLDLLQVCRSIVRYSFNSRFVCTSSRASVLTLTRVFVRRQKYPSLTVRDDVYFHNDGSESRLLYADGTIPIDYSGVRYNIPVKMYAPTDFPTAAPMCFVTPTSEMIIKPNHSIVDANGRVNLGVARYGRWDPRRSRLSDCAALMSRVFSGEPPLFSRPSNAPRVVHVNASGGMNAYAGDWSGNAGGSTVGTTGSTANFAQGAETRVPFSVNVNRRTRVQDDVWGGASSDAHIHQQSRARESPPVDAESAKRLFREAAISMLTERAQNAFRQQRDANSETVEKLLSFQTELYTRHINLEQEKGATRSMCEQIERDISLLREETVKMQSWLDAHPDTDEPFDVESAFKGEDAASQQLIDAHAKDLAIEDTLDALDDLHNDGKIPFDEYMRCVNKLCKDQFMARAEVLVVSRMQQNRGITTGVSTRRHEPSGGSPTFQGVGVGSAFLRPSSSSQTPNASARSTWLD